MPRSPMPLAQIGELLRLVMQQDETTVRELGKLGCSEVTARRVLAGKNVSLRTVTEVFRAAGYEVVIGAKAID